MRLGNEPRGGLKEYEDRWERAASGGDAARGESPSEGRFSGVKNLEGDWNVERLSGPLPMPFVWKRIRGGRGRPTSCPALGRPLAHLWSQSYLSSSSRARD